ncbi:MAG TPA: secondary thiamine-phosphate synthase enzyme YjbQ [Desulfuromonadales bacterium]|nr:secondary thiamine-phosphate synthase enzyme YjbQ [Desulfuromonadales bacterium]
MIRLEIDTHKNVELLEITREVRQAIQTSGIKDGLAVVFVPHTTAAVTINENADPDVTRDMVMELNRIIPFEDHYRHTEGNSAAHIKASLVGTSETLIVAGAEPVLGTWQGIFFCEFDGPRRRQLMVRVIPG